MLVVGPAKCAPRELFLVNGLPGLGGLLATSDDREANMSVDLEGPKGGNNRGSAAVVESPGWPARAAVLLALVGLDLPDSVAWRSSIGLMEALLSRRPLLGRERLEALPGGDGAVLLSNSCFRLYAFARLPSVIRLGSNKAFAGHLPAYPQTERKCPTALTTNFSFNAADSAQQDCCSRSSKCTACWSNHG